MKIEFNLNGRPVTAEAPPATPLLHLLRQQLGQTGVKEGCGEGECGACSVLLNGALTNSCLLASGSLCRDDRVITIEGFRERPEYPLLYQAYQDAGAVQCGYCTPGFLLASAALLRGNPAPSDEEIREGLSGNLCRCTGYSAIIEAVRLAAERGGDIWTKP